MKLKKWSWIGLLMLCVTMLVGCQGRESRGYLEELARKELSRVYPTENIEDLFEQFPKGFTVSQMRVVGDANVFVYLEAREKGKPLVGTIKQLNSKTKEEEKSITFQYVDGKFVFENEEEAKKLWPQGKFLFQELQLNKDILAKAKLVNKNYTKKEESPTGDNEFYLKYNIQLPVVNRILGIDESQPIDFSIFGYDESKGFEYEIGAHQDNITTLWEMIREIR
ncbi:hypothetical protein NQ540_08275 [Granulicatella adiacens ATCC 49175]|nr:hypothetical protein [Granulicatella adiacens]UAK93122.1 hypothetical protein K8O88_06310 [Granulicatella adiacens]UWP37887.1 hypothetical protein NQ540_08275 [Granulicatella adiacens ATCC 49175]